MYGRYDVVSQIHLNSPEYELILHFTVDYDQICRKPLLVNKAARIVLAVLVLGLKIIMYCLK